MPVSRIAFALGDLRTEIKALLPEYEGSLADIGMPPPVFEKVVSELEHHHGAKLQKDSEYRGRAVRYAGMRLVMVPVGK